MKTAKATDYDHEKELYRQQRGEYIGCKKSDLVREQRSSKSHYGG